MFVNSMSDLFHEEVPVQFIRQVFATMNATPQHTYQILTKRADRLIEVAPALKWTENIWMGVSVESSVYKTRLDCLRQVPASVRFISFEPLLGSVGRIELSGIHWVIVGGESGPQARPIKQEWICDIREQCFRRDVPFFFKQWGGSTGKEPGAL